MSDFLIAYHIWRSLSKKLKNWGYSSYNRSFGALLERFRAIKSNPKMLDRYESDYYSHALSMQVWISFIAVRAPWLVRREQVMPRRHLIILHECMKLDAQGNRELSSADLKERLLPNWDYMHWNYASCFWWCPTDHSPDALRSIWHHDFDEDIEYLYMRGYVYIEKIPISGGGKPILFVLTRKTELLFEGVKALV